MRTWSPPPRNRPAAEPFVNAVGLLAASWERQSNALRLLRGFLGVTFLYAGIQKLADPNFFRAGTLTYVGGQIQAFAKGSPIAPLLHFVDRFPTATGLTVALAEIAIGVAVLLGIGALLGAVCGCLISTILWLSATWHVHPFFLGSDSIYAVAWAAYGLSLWDQRVPARSPSPDRSRMPRGTTTGIDRRGFLRGGVVGVATLGFALFARVLSRFGAIAPSSGGSLSAASVRSTPSTPRSTVPSPKSSPSAVRGRVIASLDKLQVGQPIGFVTPDGTPGALFRLGRDKVVAYSRICTHAGCTVGYDSSAKVLFCPCHGAEFDPRHGAQVLAGPAPVPLPSIKVAIDPATHNVVLPS